MNSFGNVLIFGDSYSTFGGYIPEGYAAYYSATAPDTEVRDVKMTWWHQVITKSGSRLVQNNSWSGSTVCYTGYGGYQPEQSFAKRAADFFASNSEKIDTVFVLGCTNDSWNDSPVGELQFSDWTDDDLKACLPAFCRLLDIIRTSVPNARVINIINEEIIKKEICGGMTESCRHYNTECFGITGIDMLNSHPTVKGMRQISDQVLEKTNII